MSPHKLSASPLSSTFRQDLSASLPPRSPTATAAAAESVDSRSQHSVSSQSTAASSVGDVSRPLRPGMYVPTVTFFHDNEDLDLPTVASHAVRLAKAGVAGITTQGSNGEAVHLSRHERKLVTETTRRALDDAGFPHIPVIVGCGAQSTRETIELTREALAAGGDYALVLPPSYYKPLLSPSAVTTYFTDVASASPIPLLIYNYPAAVAGTDLDSATISTLAQHPNIIGCKLTCGNTGKLARIAAATDAAVPTATATAAAAASKPSTATLSSPHPFMCLGGSADFTLQTLIAAGSGTIAGLANLCPKACVRIITLYTAGHLSDAQKLQALVARADAVAIRGGIVATKAALQAWFGYGGCARRPLPRATDAEVKLWAEEFREVLLLEESL